MELKVNEVTIPEQITFNYEELKQEITEKVRMYETLVYTDDQFKLMKADRANFNKLKKVLNDERIRMEREYMVPFNDFKSKINEIISIIDKPVAVIDKQIKEYEEKQKQDKQKKIEEFFDSLQLPDVLEFVKLESIFESRWLNASVSMKSIQETINAKLEQIYNDCSTLSALPEFGFEAGEIYKTTLDVNKAINEAHRMSEMAKAKAAHEAEMKAKEEEEARLKEESERTAEQQDIVPGYIQETEETETQDKLPKEQTTDEQTVKEWVAFKCLLSIDDAKALGSFFESRNIEYEQI